MRHHHALLGRIDPVGNEKLPALGVVEPGNLLCEQFDQEGLQLEPFRDEAKLLERSLVGVALLRLLLFLHAADYVFADFLARENAFLERREYRQVEHLAHLRQNLRAGLKEFSAGRVDRRRWGGRGRGLLWRRAEREKQKEENQRGSN